MSWLIIALLCLTVALLYNLLKHQFDFFKNRRIPGPPPKLILGNFLDIFGVPASLKLKEWAKKYGKTFGYFEGPTPVLVTSDLTILNDIFVKKFANFHSRKKFPLQPDPESHKGVNVFQAQGLRWKRLRTISNPTFSVAKLKQLIPPISESVSVMISRMDEEAEAGRPFDIYPFYQELTLDVIAHLAFGVEDTLQGTENNEYLDLCKKIFSQQTYRKDIVFVLASIFPFIKPILSWIVFNIGEFPFAKTRRVLTKVVKDRKEQGRQLKEGQKHTDFIQLFLDAEADESLGKELSQFNEEAHLDLSNLKVKKKLTTDEIVAQCQVFLLAGFDTTANSLAYVSYLLATHPEVQDKLLSEIDLVIADQDDINYENVQRINYLELVLKESLRMYPLGAFITTRECLAPCMAGGLKFEKGDNIAADVWSIHYDTEIWGPDANQFRPERFSEEKDKPRHNLAWMPFGGGPRTCIGMRLALLEEKLTICTLLKKYRIKACPETERPLHLIGTGPTIAPEKVTVLLEYRE